MRSQEDLVPAIDCDVTDGVAVGTACSAEYPPGTRVVLVAEADHADAEVVAPLEEFAHLGGPGAVAGTIAHRCGSAVRLMLSAAISARASSAPSAANHNPAIHGG